MKVHLVGIGGIGVSALARMFLGEGPPAGGVSGSDRDPSPITEELARLGVKIFFGHRAENLPPDADLVIYTIAVPPDNPELLAAKRLGIKTLSYPEALGEISARKFTIAVAGTHGKTTTTAMLAKIFIDAGLDPTVIVGSILPTQKSNFIFGRSKYFIVEACEYRRSFLNLSPRILVITNIDNDHLDYYRDLADIESAFAELAGKLPADGALVCDRNDERLKSVLLNTRCLTFDYRQLPTTDLKCSVPGGPNKRNAQAALAVAAVVGIDQSVARRSLETFSGTWRRFEFKGRTAGGALVYDDYAHHPTEIRATLAGARELFPDQKIVVIFQPHLYSRTKLLLNDFATSFHGADQVIVLPIYAAREPFDASISAEILAEAITKQGVPARAVSGFESASNYLQNLKPNPYNLILTMGAGDIFQLAENLVSSESHD